MGNDIKITILNEAKENIENGDIKKAEILLKGYLDFNNDAEIATILARGTKLSIFDEPEAGIDLWSFQNLIQVFEKMGNDIKGSILIISHQERILRIADEIVVIADGEVLEHEKAEEFLPKLLNDADSRDESCHCWKKGGC